MDESPRRYRDALRLEPLEERFLLSIAPSDVPESLDALGAQYAPEELSPLGVDWLELKLGFDAESSPLDTVSDDTLGDATPGGASYLVHEAWGGWWHDANKTLGNREDDWMCWAAAASNILAWTGWSDAGGLATTQDVFLYFQNHWTNQGGMMEYGWDWWFDGTSNSQGWSGWSQVDVPGGGLYPTLDFRDYYRRSDSQSAAMANIDGFLRSGYGVTAGIYGPGGHAITVWGVSYDPADPSQYRGIWITDSDDDASTDNPPDRLRYYEVAYSDGRWYLQNYFGRNDWYIGTVQALARSPFAEPSAPDSGNTIHGSVFYDANGDGVRQSGESGAAGQTVYIDANNNGRFDDAVRTFAANATAQPIRDVTTTHSSITIQGAGSVLQDVDVWINVSHTWVGDLTAWLTSPSGRQIVLFAEIGGSGDHFQNTWLDDEAGASIQSASAPFTGRFRPVNALSLFDGEDPNGVWTLSVRDGYHYDTGTLHGWALSVTSSEIATQTDDNGDFQFTGLPDGSYTVRHVRPEGYNHTTPDAILRILPRTGPAEADRVAFGIAAPNMAAWGTVDFREVRNVAPGAAGQWYSFQAARSGFLTVEAVARAAGSVQLTLYDGHLNLIASSSDAASLARLDHQATAGQTFYVHLGGTTAGADFRVSNLVQVAGATVTVHGTSGDDVFSATVGAEYVLSVNGAQYAFQRSAVGTIAFHGGAGTDTVVLTGSAGSDVAELRPGSARLRGSGYSISVYSAEQITIHGGGGRDAVTLYDSAGDDVLVARPQSLELSGDGFSNRAVGFQTTTSLATAGGRDVAFIHDSAGNDVLSLSPRSGYIRGPNYSNVFRGFAEMTACATAGGADAAYFYDSPGNDVLVAQPRRVELSGAGFRNLAVGFQTTCTYAIAGGRDAAFIHGSSGNDVLVLYPNTGYIRGPGYSNHFRGFAETTAWAGGGYDQAQLHDSRGNERLSASGNRLDVTYPDARVALLDFSWVRAVSSQGGRDTVQRGAIDFVLLSEGGWLVV